MSTLVFALTSLVACDRVGRSIVGGPGENTNPPRDEGTGIDASMQDVPPRPDVPADCEAGQRIVNNVCIGEGDLTFTLTWDQPGDMDLHVVTPVGNEIYYANRMADDGVLDVDDRHYTGPENIVWAIPPSPGDYVVCVVPFGITQPTNFTVSVRSGGMMVQQWIGRRESQFEGLCTAMASTYVGTYTVPLIKPDM